MKVVRGLPEIPPCSSPIALTIGMFDGIHLGHQALIKKLHHLTRRSGTKTVLTFENHPSQVLTPSSPTPLVMSLQQRLHLLELYGVDLAIVLPFTETFSETAYDAFLSELHGHLPFSDLVLGEEAALGKGRAGDAKQLRLWAEERGNRVHFEKKERHHKEIISSASIRTLINQGELKKIKKRLGRPYSLWHPADQVELTVENENLCTWTFHETGLVSLPSGVYGVEVEWGDDKSLPAIVFLRSSQKAFSVTLYMESMPPTDAALTLSFIEYMHQELDPALLRRTPANALEDLSTCFN